MKLITKDQFLIIENDSASLTDFTSEITKHHADFKTKNVIIDLRDSKDLKKEELLAFLEISNIHRSENKSFVIINESFGIDELPEELIVVPTMQEAEDMIQMDEVQRDLGF